jgi:hypothetical protein
MSQTTRRNLLSAFLCPLITALITEPITTKIQWKEAKASMLVCKNVALGTYQLYWLYGWVARPS